MKPTSSIMNMTWKKLLILPLILAALATPLCAQTNDSNNTGTNAPAATPPVTPTQPAPQMAPASAAVPEKHDSYHPQIDPDDIVPIMGIAGVFGGGTVVVGLLLYFRYRRNKMLHETLRAMIEKGVNIPPELLSMPPESFGPRPRSDFRTGLILVGVGVALFFLLPTDTARFGLIPVLIGVAFLISWKVEQKKKDQPGK
jgi:hypothetical protein